MDGDEKVWRVGIDSEWSSISCLILMSLKTSGSGVGDGVKEDLDPVEPEREALIWALILAFSCLRRNFSCSIVMMRSLRY